ncbi:DUF7169 domain-containing protein [Cellulomonas dongxiuzhuiae]|uniref:Uncharacterized protein n=1 Tax=Cellulomonas dongxiuzhuiae TaxID=2819979 RepID=A0ABX8GMN7_9CELL|nr:hypothetical protein [Cellulomonas dongxiuzhuiae]MBO3095856.1 hypothetical protein [Cellulomonas dongxiuzhuiae]QWC17162.1 hypothetical protein KKR89_06050 [Cellulomonas dongxiuzhuiae]
MTAVTDARTALGDLVLTARSLALRLEDAEAVQWQAAPRQRPRDDTTERSKGAPPNDPTSATVLDDARLVLRAAVRRGERALGAAIDATAAAEREVDRALDAWQGIDPAPAAAA